MKAAVYYGKRDIKFEEIEDPQIEADDILVKVKASGICGSDLHSYKEGIFSRTGWVMGHELSGEVVKVGQKVKDIDEGDRVVPIAHPDIHGCGECFWCKRDQPQWCPTAARKPCGECKFCRSGRFFLCTAIRRYQDIGYGRNGGYSEYVTVSQAVLNKNVFKLPQGVTYEEGAFVEPLMGAIHWVSLAEPGPGETAVVLGLGTIGLLVMQLLRNQQVKVIASEMSPKRLQVARELGADVIIDAAREEPVQRVVQITGIGRSHSGKSGGCADIVMECSGASIALQQALEMARCGGRIVLVGLFHEAVPIDPNRVIHKQLNLVSSFARGRISRSQETAMAIDAISSGKIKVKPLISHEYPLEKIVEAFETQAQADRSVKVIVRP